MDNTVQTLKDTIKNQEDVIEGLEKAVKDLEWDVDSAKRTIRIIRATVERRLG